MKALIAIQSELNAPKNQVNKFGKYNYRSCEDILLALKPLLKKHECTLIMYDEMISVGDRVYVKANCTISDGKETARCFANAREPLQQKGMSESQITGSASSYARKYALNGMFLIDDSKDADLTNVPPTQKEKDSAEQDKRILASIKKANSHATLCKIETQLEDRKMLADYLGLIETAKSKFIKND